MKPGTLWKIIRCLKGIIAAMEDELPSEKPPPTPRPTRGAARD
jgi:hypothetical protein